MLGRYTRQLLVRNCAVRKLSNRIAPRISPSASESCNETLRVFGLPGNVLSEAKDAATMMDITWRCKDETLINCSHLSQMLDQKPAAELGSQIFRSRNRDWSTIFPSASEYRYGLFNDGIKSAMSDLPTTNTVTRLERVGSRMASSKSESESRGSSEDGSGDSSQSSQKSWEDFQHEEIVGPTVTRDMSDTANELRHSFSGLTSAMRNLTKGLIILGCIQLVMAVWNYVVPLALSFWTGLPPMLLSFFTAYTLYQTSKNLDFFSRIEERSRLRILTLSLQTIKGLSAFFRQTNVAVSVVSVGVLLGVFARISI